MANIHRVAEAIADHRVVEVVSQDGLAAEAEDRRRVGWKGADACTMAHGEDERRIAEPELAARGDGVNPRGGCMAR